MEFLTGALSIICAAAAVTSPTVAARKSSAESKLLKNIDHVTFSAALDEIRSHRQPDIPTFSGTADRPFHLRRDLQNEDERDGDGTLTCEEAFDAWTEYLSQPSWLFVQMADECVFQRTDRGNIILKSKRFHEDTEMFTDRPLSLEISIQTSAFFSEFNERFNDGEGMPNAAITLIQNDESKDVVVSVFARGEETQKGQYAYKLEQSESQADVKSLEDILGDNDKVKFDHCSIFIDTIFIGTNVNEGTQTINEYNPPPSPTCSSFCRDNGDCSGECYVCNVQLGYCYNPRIRCNRTCQNNDQCNQAQDGCKICDTTPGRGYCVEALQSF